jgi:hypothetical protein
MTLVGTSDLQAYPKFIPFHCALVPLNVIEVREEQQTKAQFSILVTLSGIIMEVRDLQHSKAYSPILVTPSGITMEVRDLQ